MPFFTKKTKTKSFDNIEPYYLPESLKIGGVPRLTGYSSYSIGFSTGGAKDTNNFRKNIKMVIFLFH